jgi:hypothetical protein
VNKSTCIVPGCYTETINRQHCRPHYYRLRRYGSFDGRYEPTPEERFWDKVEKRDGCWKWTGATNHRGYGSFGWRGKVRPAHRVAYEIANGEIPEGLFIDHICRNTSCVNPEHLRLATNKQNLENVGLRKDNTSGARGVTWDKRSSTWLAQVRHNGRQYHCGYYATVDEAAGAASAMRSKLYTHNVEG